MDSIQISDEKPSNKMESNKDEVAVSINDGTFEAESQQQAGITRKWKRATRFLERTMGLENRGIEQVPESMRLEKVGAYEYFFMTALWFSVNCVMSEATIGVLGPASYGLGMRDAML